MVASISPESTPPRGALMAGRRAIVTGGASGIGRACVRRLLAEGASVVVLDQGTTLPDNDEFGGVDYVPCDVRDEDSIAAAVGEANRLLGETADVLINCAGIYRIAPLLELSAGEWDDVVDTNLRGTFFVSRAFARALAARRAGGSIVNLASTAGLVADGGEPTAHYNASKAGVISLTKQMAVEWAPHGIRVNAVCPGVIDTPMLRLMDDPIAGRAYLDSSVPLRRLGTADEVANLILFLASHEASYVSGVAVPIDGGMTAS
jgi:NAD(P)-dependent dehydrogenase (short-subunit alcohol dehydrogenase family)